MATTTPSEPIQAAIARDLTGLAGPVILPGDDGYDQARAVYNALHDRRPAAIVRAAGAEDVAATIRFAGRHGVDLAIKGGGHSAPGFGTVDDGIVLDMSGLRSVSVDPEQRTADVDPGCTVGDVDGATHEHGLAVTLGTISSTGVAGLTLGGGFGHLTRRAGLTIDNLLEAEVVTAAGEVLVANERSHPDLFWALRGGGGNFGVVTRFTYRLHPVAVVTGGPVVFAAEDLPAVARAYAEVMAAAPDDLGGLLGVGVLPPFPFVAEQHHGTVGCIALICWTGEPGDLAEVLAPVRAAAAPLGEGLGPMPYPVMNTLFDELLPAGLHHYWKANFVTELTDEALAVHADYASRWADAEAGTFFFPMGGAAGRVPADATAFPARDATFNVLLGGIWKDPAVSEERTAFVRRYWDALQPHSRAAGYTNFSSLDDAGRVETNYGAHMERLRAVKATYDPDNLFHVNHNIVPAG